MTSLLELVCLLVPFLALGATLNIKQVAERFGVSVSTIRHWVATHQIGHLNVGRDPGKQRQQIRFTEQHMKEFEESRTNTPPPAKRRRRRKRTSGVPRAYGGW